MREIERDKHTKIAMALVCLAGGGRLQKRKMPYIMNYELRSTNKHTHTAAAAYNALILFILNENRSHLSDKLNGMNDSYLLSRSSESINIGW